MADDRLDDRLKVAVLGTSIGCKLHVRALRGAGFDVVALLGRDHDRTAARAAFFDIPIAARSFDEVLDLDIDAVVVATPPASHHELCLGAIAAGKHVLCEKPFALDVGEGRELVAAAAEAGVVGQLDHPHRWFAHRAAIREAVRSGALGEVLQANFIFDHYMIASGLDDLPDWWTRRSTGGGWIRNFASHGIDAVRFMLDEFEAVSGTLHRDAARAMTADDGYAFAFRLRNGAQGVMSGTCRSWDWCNDGRITGTLATVGYVQEESFIRDVDGERTLTPSAEVLEELLAGGDDPAPPVQALPETTQSYESIHSNDHGYREQVCLSRSFRNRILDPSYRHPAIATFDDGVAHLEVIAAVERSSDDGVWVDIDPAR